MAKKLNRKKSGPSTALVTLRYKVDTSLVTVVSLASKIQNRNAIIIITRNLTWQYFPGRTPSQGARLLLKLCYFRNKNKINILKDQTAQNIKRRNRRL